MQPGELHAFMTRFRYGVVSSIGASGAPQSALVGIATTPALEIVFDTIKESRKYPNLIKRPACSLVVGWGGEQTVQYEGNAVEPTGEALERYRNAYFEVWPECREHLSWLGLTHFAVRPTWIRYSDFAQSPPLIREFVFSH